VKNNMWIAGFVMSELTYLFIWPTICNLYNDIYY